MGYLIKFPSKPRVITFGDQKEKIKQRTKEVEEKLEILRKKEEELFKR